MVDDQRGAPKPTWVEALAQVVNPFTRGPGPLPGVSPVLRRVLCVVVLTGTLWVFPLLLPAGDVPQRASGLAVVVAMNVALWLACTRWPLLGWQLGTAVLVGVCVLTQVYGLRLLLHSGNVWFYALITWIPLPAALAWSLRGRRSTAAVWVTGLVGVVGAAVPFSTASVSYLQDAVVTVLLGLTPLLLALGVRGAAGAVDRAAAAEERAREARDARTALAERTRIAQEMHDVVAHHFSEVAVRAETAPYRVPDLPEAAVTELRAVAASAREAMDDLRRLLRVLGSPDEADAEVPQPGLADLEGLLQRARSAGTDLTWRLDTGGGVPDVIGLTAYRVVAQALANARQHAALAAVEVRVAVVGGALDVDVRNAPGVDHGPGAQLGLGSLRERVAAHDGALTAGPTDDGGWQLRAVLPLPAREVSRG